MECGIAKYNHSKIDNNSILNTLIYNGHVGACAYTDFYYFIFYFNLLSQ